MGSNVVLHYHGTLQDGTVFDSSYEDEPIEITVGDEGLLEGFCKAILGLAPGESREIDIPSKEAYGSYEDDLSMWADRSQFPDDLEVEVGGQFESEVDGETLYLTVSEIEGDKVCLDGNHPLAGEDLHFKIELLEILD